MSPFHIAIIAVPSFMVGAWCGATVEREYNRAHPAANGGAAIAIGEGSRAIGGEGGASFYVVPIGCGGTDPAPCLMQPGTGSAKP